MKGKRRKRKLRTWVKVFLTFFLFSAAGGIGLLIERCAEKGDREESSPAPAEVTAAVETPVAEAEKLRLFFTGDTVLHESVYTDARKEDGSFDFGRQLDPVLNCVQNYDLAFYNQETILGGDDLGLSGYPAFNSPQAFGTYMVSKGFNLVSTANNHCLDMGMTGITNSVNFWNSQPGVLMSGTNTSQEQQDAILSMEINGIRVAFLAYCEMTNGIEPETPYEVNVFSGHEDELAAKVTAAKENNDVVIVSLHWGTEYSHEVNDVQYQLADRLTKAGADIIIGNHPHVVQPFQMVNGKPVFYAMGNLISTQTDTDNLIGMSGALDIEKDPDTGTITMENIRYELSYTTMDGTYPDLRTNIRVIPFSQVDDSVLPGRDQWYADTQAVVTSLDGNISYGGVFE